MRFYLASRYNRYPELQGYAAEIEALGGEVTSRWLYAGDAEDSEVRLAHALQDAADVRRADLVIVFTGGPSQGGYHFETGFAMGLGIPVLLVGERESIFHQLFDQFDSWTECRNHLLLVSSLARRGILVGVR